MLTFEGSYNNNHLSDHNTAQQKMADKIEGKCLEMCPKFEIHERERHKRLSIFEIARGTEFDKVPKANHDACLKEYVRPAAGCKIDIMKLRPPYVLQRCVNHLISNVIAKDKHSRSWTDVYCFVSDRMRAIRQELVIQRADEKVSVDILKKAVRFHIVIMEELKNEKTFNREDSIQQLHSSIFTLLEHVKRESMNCFEIRVYYMLLNFHKKLLVENMLMQLLESHSSIQRGSADIIKFITENRFLFNYYRFFKVFEKLPYISSCCLITNLNFLRKNALEVIYKGYNAKNSRIPISVINEWLMFDTVEEAEAFCICNQIHTEDGYVFTNRTLALGKADTDWDGNETSWRLLGAKRLKSLEEYVAEGEESYELYD